MHVFTCTQTPGRTCNPYIHIDITHIHILIDPFVYVHVHTSTHTNKLCTQLRTHIFIVFVCIASFNSRRSRGFSAA